MTDLARFASELNVSIERGAYWELELTCTDSDTQQPINFTGCKGRMTIKKNYRDTVVTKEFTTENGLMTLSSQGVITIDNSDDFSEDLSGTYVHDIFIIDSDDKPEKYFYGSVVVNASVGA